LYSRIYLSKALTQAQTQIAHKAGRQDGPSDIEPGSSPVVL